MIANQGNLGADVCRFNATVFGNQLPEDLQISWNAHLRITAGTTHYKREPPSNPSHLPR